jgi:tetratricopeptide (TPR) repeat protein
MTFPEELDASAKWLLQAWALEQRAQIEEMRALLEPLTITEIAAEPELGVLLLNAYIYTYDRRAADVEQMLTPVFAHRGNDRLARRFLNFRGVLRMREGALSEAAEIFAELEWRSVAAKDDRTLGYALANSCVVFSLRLEIEQALRVSERTLVLVRRTRDLRSTAHVLHNIGVAYRHLGMYPDAERYLDRALRYPLSGAEKVTSDQEHALVFLETGRVDAAEALAQRAYQQVEAEKVEAMLADALRVIAMVSVARGNVDRAENELRDALSFCAGAEPQTEAEILEELAAIAISARHESESRAMEDAAAEIYTRMDAPRQVERLRSRLALLRTET